MPADNCPALCEPAHTVSSGFRHAIHNLAGLSLSDGILFHPPDYSCRASALCRPIIAPPFVSQLTRSGQLSAGAWLTEKTKSPLTDFYFCQGRIMHNNYNPRCHLEFTGNPCALSRIPSYPRQLTYASTSQNTLRDTISPAFDCALSGPFDDLFLTRFSASRALCKGMIAVISASSV